MAYYDDDDNDALMIPVDADEDLIQQEQARYRDLQLYKASKRAKIEKKLTPDAKLARARKKGSNRDLSGRTDGYKRRGAIGFKKKYSSLQKLPDAESEIKALADEMVTWVNKNEEVYKLEEFPLYKMYSPYKFFNLANANPYFEEALNYANNLIGTRLQNMLVHQGVSQNYIMKMLPLYNSQYRAWELERNAMREAQKAQNIVTVIPEWAVSPEVLEKAKRRGDESGDKSNP